MFEKSLEILKNARLKLSSKSLSFFGLCIYATRVKFFSGKQVGQDGLEGYVKYDPKDLTYENVINLNADHIEDNADYKTKNMIDILLHEFNHILRRHALRENGRKHDIWNIACDHIIDSSIKKLGVSTPYFQWNIIKRIEGLKDFQSEEKVYDWIVDQMDQNKIKVRTDGHSMCLEDTTNGQRMSIGNDVPIDVTPEMAAATENYIAQIRAIYNIEKERGNVPSNISEMVEKLLEVKIPWEVILEKAIKNMAFEKTTRRSWKRPNKYYRNLGVTLPGSLNTTNNEGIGTLLVHIDSSGSISSKELAKAGYVIYKSFKYFQKIVLVVADVEIHQREEFIGRFENDKFLEFFKQGIKGRGGTSHKFVFKEFGEYITDNPDEVAIVISITDMYSDIGESLTEFPINKTVPIVFLSTSGKQEMKNLQNVTVISIE